MAYPQNNVGFVKVNRDIVEMADYFGHPFTRKECWLDLLILAEWRESRSFLIRGNKVTVKKDQVAISLRELSDRWNLSVNTVRKVLGEFKECGKIDIHNSNVINIISVFCNSYDTQTDTQTDTQNTTQADTQTDTQNNTLINSISTSCNSCGSQTTTQNDTQNDTQSTTRNSTQTDTLSIRNKEYKEINNNSLSTTRTRVCETEKLHLELENDQVALEGFAMSLRAPMAKLLDLLERFKGWAIGTGESYGNYTEYRRKFYTWASIEINHDKRPTYQKRIGGPINPPSYGISGRRNPQAQTDFP